MLWYIREASTAIYVSNLPMLWPLFRRVFNIGTFQGSTPKDDSQPLSQLSSRKKDTMTSTSLAGSEEQINTRQTVLEIDQRISFTVEEYHEKPGCGIADLEAGRQESRDSMGPTGLSGAHGSSMHHYHAEISSGERK
jgi:hypothetical protein